MSYNTLTPEERNIIEQKGTEAPFLGEYDDFFEEGTFICRKCNSPLFSSKSKFDAHCGWPSYDDNFPLALIRKQDKNSKVIEILCSNCKGHLGHVFEGEQMTPKNTRHCVNSLSLKFIPKNQKLPSTLNA